MGLPTPADGAAPGYFGVYPAIVTDLVDRDRLGRVEVRFPWLGTEGDEQVRAWATLCTPYADDEQGLLVLPEVGSQVLVAFEAGNLRRPYVIGAAWNGRESLPHEPEAANNIRILRTRADSRLTFDDTAGAEKVGITMAAGHEVVLDNATQEITVRHANGCVLRMTAAGGIELTAVSSVQVTAPAGMRVSTPLAQFTGIVECQVLKADALVQSPAYTPGAGNLW
ncbi:hypothetical protein GCM10010174_19500 [Kutzneria viridogrisea]|uniref:Uncharacterized protein involved in type VI secretion and phage assembly n=1 Tax=Kutzneria viridogrisea TaxID=47990 RepID=A0ABR6B7Y0_9PSEU|nr:uncharacterized protein involved in type VI secretion and phage assembly [Kutzneria viridogrisea]